MTSTEKPLTVKLSASKHALDWYGRSDEFGDQTTEVAHTARTVTFEMTRGALADLVSDALYYAAEMGPESTGDVDYRPAARTCLRALERAGVAWTRRRGRGFSVEITAVPA